MNVDVAGLQILNEYTRLDAERLTQTTPSNVDKWIVRATHKRYVDCYCGHGKANNTNC